MSYFRPDIDAMAGYTPGEQPQGGGYVKLNTNENPYPPSPRVLEAVRSWTTEALRLYPDPMAGAVRDKAAEVYGLRPENVLVGNGSDDLLTIIMRCFADRGDPIAYPMPTYTLYRTLAQIQGTRPVEVAFADDYSLPDGLRGIEAKIVFLANPNSPSATLVAADEVASLAASLRGVLVVDEAYVDFAEGDCLDLVRGHPNVIVLRTFSKSFSMCGLRVGLALASADLIAGMVKVKDSYNVNRLAAVAAAAALDDLDHMRANAERIKATRERLTRALEEMGVFVLPSQANFILACIPAASERPSARDLYRQLKQRRILVRYFDQPRLDDCLRITVGSDEEIDVFLERLREIWR